MAIPYKSIARKKSQDFSQSEKFYAGVANTVMIDLMNIAKKLFYGSATRIADIFGILLGFIYVIKQELVGGRIIRLGDLNDFRIIVKSSGENLPQAVTTNNITSGKVRFLSGKEPKKMLRNLEFNKVLDY